MQKFSKGLVVLGIVVGVLITGALIGMFAGGHAAKTRPVTPPPPTTTDDHAARPLPTDQTGVKPVVIPPATHLENNPGETVAPTETVSGILTNWEEKVDEILGADTDNTNKVRQLFALFPHVPDESKSEVAQHLSNLTGDEAYPQLRELLKDPGLGSDTLDVLMADALNRPNSLKLPALLEVAETPNHPKADEAKDILALFLDEDLGTDWAKWREKMAAWLKDNPD